MARRLTLLAEVRIRWQDFISGPDGVKRLASLRAAVQKMKSLDK